MSISTQTLDQRILFRHSILERNVDSLGLKPQAAIVADVTGASPSGFGTTEPIAITTDKLENLLGLDVTYAANVPNRLGGDKKELAISAKFDAQPDEWLKQVCLGTPELKKLLNALNGLYALKNKLDTLLGKPAETALQELLNDPSKAKSVLQELQATDAQTAAKPEATAKPEKPGKKS